ncbi:hypothetical protein [Caballeronia telluris]|uniref:Uncharacterized protein n=1 Tax=Caballeronia telluris TaxID=326475 RepID=A0A158KEJ4_9BURK|nr:hypothetical protein [Caballeronia telluris]SAL78851.1 hypothetical protein AWB66_05929 [Caballeronia telluris]
MSNRARKLIAYDGSDALTGVAVLDKPKTLCIVATVLEDAVALQRMIPQASAIVTPAPAAFAALRPDKAVKEYQLYLAGDIAAWLRVASDFVRTVRQTGAAARIILPSGAALSHIGKAADDKAYWWQVLKGVTSLDAPLMDEFDTSGL